MLLPEPDGPTRAVEVPGRAMKEIPCSTGAPGLYSKVTSRNSTSPRIGGRSARASSPESSAISLRISRILSRPAKASVIWLPIETIWTTGPTSIARSAVNWKRAPIVIRPARTSLDPTQRIETEIAPKRIVEKAVTAEKPVIVFATLRKRRWTPLEKTSASRRSARYAFTTRIPEKDSVSRPDTSALILERSRKSGRSVLKAYRSTKPKRERTDRAIAVSFRFKASRMTSAMTAVRSPPTTSTRPVPTRLRIPSASVMTRERSAPTFV